MSANGRERAIVIGAGPAGLAAAATLAERGVAPLVLERGDHVGAAWRGRYDRLRLHTARALSGLPRHRIPRAYGRWVARDDLVQYLEDYAARFGIEPRFGVAAKRIDRAGDGAWRVETTDGPLEAPLVVVASGHSCVPYVPDWPGRATFAGPLVHSSEYRNPERYRGLDTLVVGSGNSGVEIACDLGDGGAARVRIAIRTPPHIVRRDTHGLPNQPLGIVLEKLPPRAVDVVGRAFRRLTIPDLSTRGLPTPPWGPFTHYLESGVVPVVDVGFVDAVRDGRLEVVAGVDRFEDGDVVLVGGERMRPDAIVAATGYRTGLEPLVGHLGILNVRGEPLAHAGRTHPAAPGLHFIGYTRRSAGCSACCRVRPAGSPAPREPRNLVAPHGVVPPVEGRPLDDTDLIERARAGDAHAYEEIVHSYQGIAFRTAYLLAGNAADAEEAAQDGFVKAFRALGRFRRGSPFRPWLLAIVANEARNRRRSSGRRAALAVRAAADPDSGGAAPSPETALLAREERERLLALVNGLPDDARDVIACRFFLGLSEEETAATLGLPQGTVKSRTARALERLRVAYD